jgi:hypothetical protein
MHLHPTSVMRLVKAGKLPRPYRVGRWCLWRTDHIIAAIEGKG